MKPAQIKKENVVTKGTAFYTVVTGPIDGIFLATDQKGQTVTLSTHEFLALRPGGSATQ